MNGYLFTPWVQRSIGNRTQNIMEVSLDYRGDYFLDNYGNLVTSHFQVAVPQQWGKIKAGIEFTIAEFFLDDITYAALAADPKYQILFLVDDKDSIYSVSELNDIKNWLLNIGLTNSEINQMKTDLIRAKSEIYKDIRSYVKAL